MAYYSDDKGWYCKYCDETDFNDFAGFNPSYWQLLDDNERFLKFVNGEEPNA
jgi:hypothetical protein